MTSPLFNALGGSNMKLPANMGNFMQMVQQFNQFKSNFQGDPKQKVQELLNSGQMSKSQYNQLQQMATQFQQLLK